LKESEITKIVGRQALLVLGAALPQVSIIKRAKEMGHRVVCVSIPGNYPGFTLADSVYHVDTRDKERVLKIAEKEKIDGVVTTGTDVAVRTVGYVCERLGLHGLSYCSAASVTDKALMKEALIRGGVRTAEFYKVSSAEEAKTAVARLGFPVMVKCVDKSGSRGITKVEDNDYVENAFNDAMFFSDQPYAVVEKYIEGVEIGLDGYVNAKGRKYCFLAPYNRKYYNNKLTNIPWAQSLPFAFPDDISDEAKKQAVLSAHALDITNGFINMDLLVNDDGVWVIEIGARGGGAMITEMMESYFGIDYFGSMICNALGEGVNFEITRSKPSISEIFISEKSGIVEELSVDTKNIDGIEYLAFSIRSGDRVKEFKKGSDTYGGAVVSGDTVEEARETMELLKRRIKLVLREGS
jgi:biotin carboxylase